MNQKQFSFVALSIIILSIISSLILVNAYTMLQKLNKYNPLMHSDATKSFVYSRPAQQNTGVVYDVYAILNAVNVARGEYELIVKADHGGANALKAKFQRYGGTTMLLQQTFNFTYVGNTDKEGIEYHVYKLIRLNDLITRLFADVHIGKLSRFHVVCF